MPREVIHPSTPRREGEGPRFQAVVGWNRDQDVQVGIQTEDDYHLVDAIYGGMPTRAVVGRLTWEKLHALAPLAFQPFDFRSSDEEAEFYAKVGREVLDAVTGSEVFGTSVWWTPTRSQVNALIRLLRKARDAAYGRDE